MSLLEGEVVASSKRGAAADLAIRSWLDSAAVAGRGAGAGAAATEGAVFFVVAPNDNSAKILDATSIGRTESLSRPSSEHVEES